MSADISLDMTSGIEVEVEGKRGYYTPPMLQIEGKGVTLSLALTDEQLSDIGYAIYEHLKRTGSHAFPDHQQALNHEHEEAAGDWNQT